MRARPAHRFWVRNDLDRRHGLQQAPGRTLRGTGLGGREGWSADTPGRRAESAVLGVGRGGQADRHASPAGTWAPQGAVKHGAEPVLRVGPTRQLSLRTWEPHAQLDLRPVTLTEKSCQWLRTWPPGSVNSNRLSKRFLSFAQWPFTELLLCRAPRETGKGQGDIQETSA